MFKSYFHNLDKAIKTTILALTCSLAAILIIQLLLPISIDNTLLNTSANESLLTRNTTGQTNVPTTSNNYLRSFRTGLFKSAVALKGKPLADKTIERIKSQLKLRCIMTINAQLVAYIEIKNNGCKKCAVGDSVNDMFTVLNIDNAKKSVDISIIDHKVTLYM